MLKVMASNLYFISLSELFHGLLFNCHIQWGQEDGSKTSKLYEMVKPVQFLLFCYLFSQWKTTLWQPTPPHTLTHFFNRVLWREMTPCTLSTSFTAGSSSTPGKLEA